MKQLLTTGTFWVLALSTTISGIHGLKRSPVRLGVNDGTGVSDTITSLAVAENSPVVHPVTTKLFYAVVAVTMVVLLVGRVASQRFQPPAAQAKLQLFLVAGLDGLIYAAFVPDSLGVARAHDADAATSGWMICIHKTFCFLGLLSLWAWSRGDPLAKCRAWTKTIIIVALSIMLASTLCYIATMRSLSGVAPFGSWFILFCRALCGLACGVSFTVSQFVAIFTEPHQRAAAFAQLAFVHMISIGMGPIVCAGAHVCLDGLVAPYNETPCVMAALTMLALGIIWAHFPDLQIATAWDTDAWTGETALAVGGTPENIWRGVFLTGCVAFSGLRAFAVSSVESATSMILRDEFGWGVHQIGIGIGLSFLFGVPFKFAFDMIPGGSFSVRSALRLPMVLTLIGCMCLFPLACSLMPAHKDCALVILLGDALVFPSLFFANGIVDGKAMNHVSNVGLFTRENLILAQKFMIDACGRTFGPPIARVLMDGSRDGSRSDYALLQTLVGIAAWMLVEGIQGASSQAIPDPEERLNKLSDCSPEEGTLEVCSTASDVGTSSVEGLTTPSEKQREEESRGLPKQAKRAEEERAKRMSCGAAKKEMTQTTEESHLPMHRQLWLSVLPVSCTAGCAICFLAMAWTTQYFTSSARVLLILRNSCFIFGTHVVNHFFMGWVKITWLRRVGFSEQQLSEYFSSKQDLNLESLIDKFGNRQLMIMDGIVRKSAHLVFNMVKMLLWSFVIVGAEATMFSTLGAYTLLISSMLLMVFVDKEPWNWFWGPSRIRDGWGRRWNIVNANAGSGVATLITFYFWFSHIRLPLSPAAQAAMLTVLWMPLGVGDAMAEIVGVLFGYHRFKVYGVGEYNDKSWEGCAGMFLSTLLCSVVVVAMHGLLTISWLKLLLAIAAVSTVLETWTPRAFDNFTITLGACLVCMAFVHFGML